MTSITFASLDLQASPYTTTLIESYSPSPIENQVSTLAFSDGGVLVKRRYDVKIVHVEGIIRNDTIIELDDTIDFFNRSLNRKQAELTIGHGGGSRIYQASPQNIQITRPQGMNIAKFSVDFLCVEPFGTDATLIDLYDGTVTISPSDISLNVEGSYKAEPTITIDYSSITGGSSGTITLSNAVTLESMTVSADFTTGDILVVNTKTKEVTLNGGQVEFTGRIPAWQPGAGILTYSDSFTARSGDMLIQYNKRYI